MKLLTNSYVRKVIYVLIGAAVTFLNNHFGLSLNTDDVMVIWGIVVSLITVEAHFNVKKFIVALLPAVSAAAQSATTLNSGQPIQSVTQPPTSQAEATQLMNELTSLLNPIYNEVKTGKFTDATMKALQAATDIRDYLKAGESDATKSA